jgi:hypothetical protein
VSRRKWPWILLGLLLLAAGVGGGWFWKSYTTSERSASSHAMSEVPSAAKIAVTIGDETVQIGSDKTGHIETGHKGTLEISGAELEKLALMLRPPGSPWIAIWGPPGSAILVALVALFGVLRSSHTTRISDARSEWFRRFKDMLDMALDKNDEHRSAVGITMLSLHVESDLAGKEERELAVTVFTDLVKPKLDYAIKMLQEADEAGDKVRFVVGDDPPVVGDTGLSAASPRPKHPQANEVHSTATE